MQYVVIYLRLLVLSIGYFKVLNLGNLLLNIHSIFTQFVRCV